MPILANQRHEKFAQGLFAGLTKTAAYLTLVPGATPKTAEQSGSRLSRNVKIQSRVAELQARSLSRLEITAEMIAAEAWGIATDRDCGPGPRVSALALLAKRHAEFSEKHEVSGGVDVRILAAVAELTPDDLRTLAAKR